MQGRADRSDSCSTSPSSTLTSENPVLASGCVTSVPSVDPNLTVVQDGEEFLYITSLSKSLFSGWWDALSAAWRYGPLSPYRTSSAVGAMLKKFSNFYNPKWLIKHGAARSIEEFVDRVELGRDITNVKGEEWALKTVGVSEKWMGEIMEGSTRVNVS